MTSAKIETGAVAPRHHDPEVVRQAEEIFVGIGMTPEETIGVFYKIVVLYVDGHRASQPLNAESLAAFNEPRKSIAIYTIVAELMSDLCKADQISASSAMKPKAASPACNTPGCHAPGMAQKAEVIFAQLEVTPAEAIATFYERTARHDECLLCLAYGKTLNDETLADISDTHAAAGIRKYASVAEMRADMDKDA